MSSKERSAFMILLLIAIGLWALVGYDFYNTTWKNPLGPALSLPSLKQFGGGNSAPAARPTGPTSTLRPGQPTRTPYTPEVSGQPKCGGPLTMTILAVGSDSRGTGYLYGLGDVIRYVRVDFVTPRVTVLEFPRDIWVEIPELDPKHGIDHGKLNQAYLYGNKGMGYYHGPGEGPGLLARTLQHNFGAAPQHYVAANMQTFVKLVDSVGGVDVVLPHSVDARKPDQPNRYDLYFKAGKHHLNGSQALMLARIRQQSTFERADNQNLVLCALRDALLKPANLAKLPKIIDSFDNAVQTDLSPQQISQLACLLPYLEPHNIQFITFPLETLEAKRTYDKGVDKDVYIFEADFVTLRLLVGQFERGQWPPRSVPSPVTVTPGTSTSESGFICP
jgi:LCP family protein required for cell wall assembly